MVTSAEAKGFGLWGIRAVLNGRGDEVIDLATSGNFIKSLLN